jgi:hypothetical protein
MIFRTLKIVAIASTLMAASVSLADKVNYEDHLLPLLRNECTSCHNPDKKKAGLDCSSYQALMAGSDTGPVVNPGDPDGSTLWKVVAHIEDPYMPKGKAKLADKDLEIIKQFIVQGALPNATGKAAVVKARPKLNLTVASGTGKPAGPVAMPKDLILEPVIHTSRPGALMCLAASPWAPLVAVGGQHQVLLYNTNSLDLIGVLAWPEGEPYVSKFSLNGSVLLVGGGVAAKSGHVVLFDVVTGKRITQIGDEFDAVIAADVAPDQSMVALGGPSKVVKIFATADGQQLQSIKKHTDWITALGFSPDGVLLASGDRQGGLWVWESKSGNEFYNLSGHKAAITSVCFRSDSNILASASEDGTVKLWDMQNGKEVKSFQAHGPGTLSVHFTQDGRLVTCGRDKVVRLWKPDGSGQANTEPFADIALHAVFDGEGKHVVAGDYSGVVRVFDGTTGKTIGTLSSDPAPIADRLAEAKSKLPAAQGAFDKAAAELAGAQKASDKSAADLQAANLASVEAKKTIDRSKANEKALADGIEPARNAVKVAQDAIGPKRSDIDRLAKALKDVIATRDAADREKKTLADAVAMKQKSANEASDKAAKAKADADKTPDNQQLASAAKEARSTADRVTTELADAQKALGAKGDQLNGLNDQVTKAQVGVDQAKAAFAAAEEIVKSKQAALQKQNADHQTAAAAINAAQQAAQNAEKLVAQRTTEAKAAAEQLSKVKPNADTAAQQLATAKHDIAHLEAALFNVGVWAARNDLSARQSELDKTNQAMEEDKGAIAKAKDDITATKKLQAEGPATIKAREGELANLKAAASMAAAVKDQTEAALNERVALASQSADVAQKLAALAAKTADDKTLADAAAKAKASADAAGAVVEAFKPNLAAKLQSSQQAQQTLASTQSAVDKLKADLASAPKTLEKDNQTIQTATADLAKQQNAAGLLAKAVAAAKAHADDLSGQYQKMAQEASAIAGPGIPKS